MGTAHSDFQSNSCRGGFAESEILLKEQTNQRIPYEQMVYVTGSDVQNKKPDPELFLKAAAQLGLDPARCVVIEDAPDGVEAAHAAGCRCIAVTNSASREKLKTADRIVSTLEDVGLQTVMDLIEQGD